MKKQKNHGFNSYTCPKHLDGCTCSQKNSQCNPYYTECEDALHQNNNYQIDIESLRGSINNIKYEKRG